MQLLLVLCLACFAGAYSIRLIDPIIPELARSFDVVPATAALLVSAFTFPYALGQPLLGPMADTVGKARVIKIGLGILTICLIVAALAPSLEVIFVARALAGLAGGAIIPVALAMIGDRVAYSDRQIALSQLLSAMLASQFASLIGTGLVASWIGWRYSIGLAAAVAFVAFLVTLIGIKPRRVQRPPIRLKILREGYSEVFSNPRAKVCYAAVFVEGITIFGLLPFVAALMEARGAGGIAQAGIVLASMGIGGLVFTFAVKRLLRRLGGMHNLIRLGGVIAAIGYCGVAAQGSWPFEAAAFLLVGLGFYSVHNSLQTLATELAPEHRGSAVALHAFFFFLGNAAGPPIYSLGFGLLGVSPMILISAAVVATGGFVLAAALRTGSPEAEGAQSRKLAGD